MELWHEFRLRRDEIGLALLVLVFFGILQGLQISKFWEIYVDYTPDTWRVFMRNFHMSGFDPFSYSIVTDWHIGYTATRHPLLSFFLFPLWALNKLLWWLTGANCVQFIIGALLLFSTLYSAIFLRRLLREIVGVKRFYADVLVVFFFSIAYIMLACLVPDHFVLSMMFLLLTLYRAGTKLKDAKKFDSIEVSVLLVIVGGITLSNAIVVLLAAWFVNGREFWQWKPIALYFVICVALLVAGTLEDTEVHHRDKKAFETWVDTTTPRWQSVTDNMFGEAISLHEKPLLGDVLVKRPLFVKYKNDWSGRVNLAVAVLFVLGAIAGCRKRFFWLLMSVLAYTAALHLGLGFGLNEVYIMSAHWMFAIPICIGYLFALSRPRWMMPLLAVFILGLSTYLYYYNTTLLYSHLIKELRYK